MREIKRPLNAAERKADAIQRRDAAHATIRGDHPFIQEFRKRRELEALQTSSAIVAARPPQAVPAAPPAALKLIPHTAVLDGIKVARKAEGKQFNQSGLARRLKLAYPDDPGTHRAILRRVTRALEAEAKKAKKR